MKKQTYLLVPAKEDAPEQRRFSFEDDIAIHCKRLYRFLYGLCRDEELSKDLLQDTLLKAQYHIMQGFYIERGVVWCWLKAIAQNTLFKHYRQQRMQRLKLTEQKQQICDNLGWDVLSCMPDETWEDEENSMDAIQHTREKISDHIAILMKSRFRLLSLTQAERNLITERHLRMKSFKELSSLNDTSISTTMSRYYTTMKKVQRQLVQWEQKGLLKEQLDLKELKRIKRAEDAVAARKARKGQHSQPKKPSRN